MNSGLMPIQRNVSQKFVAVVFSYQRYKVLGEMVPFQINRNNPDTKEQHQHWQAWRMKIQKMLVHWSCSPPCHYDEMADTIEIIIIMVFHHTHNIRHPKLNFGKISLKK